MSPSMQFVFENSSSSSSDDSDIEDLIYNDDLENLILILAVNEFEFSNEFNMSEEDSRCSTKTKEKPCRSTDPLPADVVDSGDATHAHGVQLLKPAADGNEPAAGANDFQQKLIAAEESLHSRTEVSHLSFVKQMMELKARHNMSDGSVDALLALLCDVSPEGHRVPANVSECQNLLTDLKIPSIKTQGETSSKRKQRLESDALGG